MQKKTLTSALLTCGLALSGPALAQTPAAAPAAAPAEAAAAPSAPVAMASGSMLGNTCAGCHGTDGNSQGPATPTIAGISSEYFIGAMTAYKSDTRPSTIMARIAKGYSEGEIKAMAEFFATKPFKAVPQESDATLAKHGANLHKKYCEKCHEEGGTSTKDDAGILAGQWTPYLSYTMEDFMGGKREMDKKMKKKLDEMHGKTGDEGIKQLLNFYAGRK
ncbi:MAG: c-type cytochrome [Gammaproteobacteria bacterium]|nr:c-type cytochrome [Gammaproteobacteria bacterium]MBU1653753.1 c-type cytochrome [Gammaproteobacteria bacterium]MBU1962536.1 c-type cytochrome [Gammaproteobacteria bacterium]